MEGVGARLGRSSTRYGPTTVFTGPVRKWKKKWVHVSPSNSSSQNQSHRGSAPNGSAAANGSNGSHLLLYKWTPLTPSPNSANNGAATGNGESREDQVAAAAEEERPRRKFKYIPIALLEEPKNEEEENEDAEKDDEKEKQSESDANAAEPVPKSDNSDEKPDINDVPMEESQDADRVVRQDLNESTLDLSLGLNAKDGDHESDSKADQSGGGQLERVISSNR